MNALNLTTEAYVAKLNEAITERNKARAHYEATRIKGSARVRREADEALEFWTSKLAFIAAAA
jgi:hypothetical protein